MEFQVAYQDVLIKAQQCCICSSDVSAEIIQPEGIKGLIVFAPHIPYFAMPKGDWYYKNGIITEKAIKCIEYRMKEAYANYTAIKNNLKKIRLKLMHIKIASLIAYRGEAMLSDDLFKTKKKGLKKQLRSGEYDNIVYQKKLVPLKKMNEKYHSMKWQIEDSFRDYLRDKYGIQLNAWNTEIYIDKFILGKGEQHEKK